MLRVLYIGLKHDQGRKGWRISYEHLNYWKTLEKMQDIETFYFPVDEYLHKMTREKTQEELKRFVSEKKPDVLIVALHKDEIDKSVIASFSKKMIMVGLFSDDNARFYNYSRHWAPLFHLMMVFYKPVIPLYEKMGVATLYVPGAVNPDMYYPIDNQSKNIDVSFVGSCKPIRKGTIHFLEREGINVFARGNGWPEGVITHEDVLRVFSQSKINLQIDSPPELYSITSLGKLFFRRAERGFRPDFFNFFYNLKTLLMKNKFPELRARPFEILACRAFPLASYADGISECYEDGKEIVIYKDKADLLDKIKYYLSHEAERESIAKAGYERTIRDHTFEKHFSELLRRVKSL